LVNSLDKNGLRFETEMRGSRRKIASPGRSWKAAKLCGIYLNQSLTARNSKRSNCLSNWVIVFMVLLRSFGNCAFLRWEKALNSAQGYSKRDFWTLFSTNVPHRVW
jgi:hypothetical protein